MFLTILFTLNNLLSFRKTSFAISISLHISVEYFPSFITTLRRKLHFCAYLILKFPLCSSCLGLSILLATIHFGLTLIPLFSHFHLSTTTISFHFEFPIVSGTSVYLLNLNLFTTYQNSRSQMFKFWDNNYRGFDLEPCDKNEK